jgi:predicted secreted protein
MRARLLLSVVSLSVLLLAGCAGTESLFLIVTCDEFAEQPSVEQAAETSVGATVSVRLCSNQTTGYAWEETIAISDPAVARVANRTYESPADASQPVVGAAGSEVITLEAVAAGTTAIAMSYGQPWEGGEKGAWTYSLTLTVR